MTGSIRRRLLLILSATTLLATIALVVEQYREIRDRVHALFDAHLAQSAHVLYSLVSSEIYERYATAGAGHAIDPIVLAELRERLAQYRYEKQLAFQFSIGPERLKLHSAGAPDLPLSGEYDDGLTDNRILAVQWRVCTLRSPDRLVVVRVAEPQAVRDRTVARFLFDTMWPLALLVPLLPALIWFSVGAGLRPLGLLAGEIGRREPAQLDAIDLDEAPTEAQPIIAALNRLFRRLQAALDNARRFTADAAHELRTPLAGIRTQAEVAAAATDTQVRDNALRKILGGVEAATHLVSQLLTLARLDPESGTAAFIDVDLRQVAREVVAQHAALAERSGIALDFSPGTAPLIVRGNTDALAILLRNLVDNAIRYTPAPGRVVVALGRDAGRAQLTVDDSGPGVAPADRARVMTRFHRGKHVDRAGCGLGLSIVEQVAQLHRAEVQLTDSGLGGLRVAVGFPASD